MRRLARVVVFIVGSVLGLVGLATAILAGPDDTVRSGEQQITSDTPAVIVSSSMLEFMGPTVHVAAAPAAGGPVFLGIGHEVDVSAYLDGVAHEVIWQVSPPFALDIEPVTGDRAVPDTAPATRDWWIVQATGADRQEIAFLLRDEPVNVVIMSGDGEPPVAADVEFGLEVENLFTTALIALGAGLALLALGVFALRRPRQRVRAVPDAVDDQWTTTEERHL